MLAVAAGDLPFAHATCCYASSLHLESLHMLLLNMFKTVHIVLTVRQLISGTGLSAFRGNRTTSSMLWRCTHAMRRMAGVQSPMLEVLGAGQHVDGEPLDLANGRSMRTSAMVKEEKDAFKAVSSDKRLRVDVNRVSGFLEAHREARTKFRQEFCQTLEDTTDCEKLILKESEMESDLAQELSLIHI